MKLRSTLMLLVLVALISGCQSTSIRSAWFDTEFTGPPMRKIIVVAGTDNVSNARAFEDAFVERLRAAGVDGIAGYTVVTDAARASEATFVANILNSGAQGLLLVRLLGVDTRAQVSTIMVPGGIAWGGGTWSGPTRMMVPVQQVSQYDLATVETKLFETKTKQLVWAATTSTFNPRSVARETPAFADLIIGQLVARGIIQAK